MFKTTKINTVCQPKEHTFSPVKKQKTSSTCPSSSRAVPLDVTMDLVSAARGGDLNGVRKYLIKVKRLVKSCENTTVMNNALFEASANGHLEVVRWLVKHGVNVDSLNPYVKSDLDARFNLLIDSRFGFSALSIAAYNGHLEVVKYLILVGKANIKLSAKNGNYCHTKRVNKGDTALLLAAKGGRISVVRWLFTEHLVDIGSENTNGDNCLTIATASNQLKMIMWLIHVHKPDLNFQNTDMQSVLVIAAYWGHVKIVQYLLTQPGIKINHPGYGGVTALHQAAYHGHLRIIRLLVKVGADCNLLGNGMTPVCSAVFNNKIKVVDWFLRHDLVDISDPQLMFIGASLGRIEIMKLMFKYGVHVNGRNKHNKPALLKAAEKRHFNIVCWLVKDASAGIYPDQMPSRIWKQRDVLSAIQDGVRQQKCFQTHGPQTLTKTISSWKNICDFLEVKK